jgi:hypothetical protein
MRNLDVSGRITLILLADWFWQWRCGLCSWRYGPFVRKVSTGNMSNKLLIRYESTKYIYRQKLMHSITKTAKACFKMLHHNVYSSILSIKLQQFTFSLTEETCNPKIKRLFGWCLNEINNKLIITIWIWGNNFSAFKRVFIFDSHV